MKEDIRKALLIVWIAVSFASLGFLLASSFLPGPVLHSIIPECPQKLATGKPCPLCGMTHAFVLLSGGDTAGAVENNPYSPGLYFGILLNLVVLRVVLGFEILLSVDRTSRVSGVGI